MTRRRQSKQGASVEVSQSNVDTTSLQNSNKGNSRRALVRSAKGARDPHDNWSLFVFQTDETHLTDSLTLLTGKCIKQESLHKLSRVNCQTK